MFIIDWFRCFTHFKFESLDEARQFLVAVGVPAVVENCLICHGWHIRSRSIS